MEQTARLAGVNQYVPKNGMDGPLGRILWLSLANRSSAITSIRKNQLIRGGGVKLCGVVLANGDVDSPNTCMT
jgi:hypothetical protein